MHVSDANTLALATAFALSSNPCVFAHFGTNWTLSAPSDSFAIAPFQVSTPIEITTSTAATIATGRRSSRRSRRRS